jgi:predicted RNA-binding protein with PIN domain
MALHYIIDGYNLIRHRSFAPPANIHDPRFALIQFLRKEKPCGSAKNKVTIIFDGYSGDPSLRDLEFKVIFSCDESADERIRKIVESEPLPGTLIVVSDDRQIRDFTKLNGAVSLGIDDFLKSAHKKTVAGRNDPEKKELSYTAAHKINEELKRLWLKK